MVNLQELSDDELLCRLHSLSQREREDIADLVAHLAEADHRELLVKRGFPSLFAYCVQKLGYSEAAAYLRIRAARAYRISPAILEMLTSGEIHIDAVARLFPHLDGHGGMALLEQAKGKTSRQVMAMVADLSLAPDAPDIIRPVGRCPDKPDPREPNDLFSQPAANNAGSTPSHVSTEAAPSQDSPNDPQTSEKQRVRFAFTADDELLSLVKRAREVLRHKHPDGRLEKIFRDALLALLEKRDPDRRRLAALPRASARRVRRVPQWVKDAVWSRDGGSCAYISEDGRRCESRDDLEYDHIKPWALGGASDAPGNIRLLCRTHNHYLARQLDFGSNSG